jgi:hypothetical protein
MDWVAAMPATLVPMMTYRRISVVLQSGFVREEPHLLKAQPASRAARDALPAGQAPAVFHRFTQPGVVTDVDVERAVERADPALNAEGLIGHNIAVRQDLMAGCFRSKYGSKIHGFPCDYSPGFFPFAWQTMQLLTYPGKAWWLVSIWFLAWQVVQVQSFVLD